MNELELLRMFYDWLRATAADQRASSDNPSDSVRTSELAYGIQQAITVLSRFQNENTSLVASDALVEKFLRAAGVIDDRRYLVDDQAAPAVGA